MNDECWRRVQDAALDIADNIRNLIPAPPASEGAEVELPLRPLIEAILRRYHTTRLSEDAVEHILSGPIVREEFEQLFDACRNFWKAGR